jgi:hypothetical protein
MVLGTSPALAQAAPNPLPAPGDVGAGGKTYAQLIAMALPGARDDNGRLVIDADITVPHVEGDIFTMTAPAPVKVERFHPVRLVIDDQPHLALMIGLEGGSDSLGPISALALFDIANVPRLVDVVDVGFDRQSGFAAPPTLKVGAGHELILAQNSHGNTGQYYSAATLIDLEDGALTMIDQVMTLSDLGCEGTRTQTVDYEALAPEAPGRGDFTVTVREEFVPPEEACEGVEPYAPSETSYSVTYRWDAATGQYTAEGDGWAALDDLNSQRF